MTWNRNGNWFLTASGDCTSKLFDVRNMKTAVRTYWGHTAEVTRVAWHPVHDNVFSSSSVNGVVHFWSAEYVLQECSRRSHFFNLLDFVFFNLERRPKKERSKRLMRARFGALPGTLLAIF